VFARAPASWAAAGRPVINTIPASAAATINLLFIHASIAAVAAFRR
jgi:hypothetical protein